LAARLLTQFREAGGELVKRRERPGGIPAQRAGAHQQLRGRLRVWLQCKRAPGPLARARLARCSECLLTRRDQRGGRPSTVPVPLLCSPFLERGRALYGEALEKIAPHEPRGFGRAALQQRGEPQRIDLEPVVAQHDRVTIGREARFAEV